jgi:hypothetical protein
MEVERGGIRQLGTIQFLVGRFYRTKQQSPGNTKIQKYKIRTKQRIRCINLGVNWSMSYCIASIESLLFGFSLGSRSLNMAEYG